MRVARDNPAPSQIAGQGPVPREVGKLCLALKEEKRTVVVATDRAILQRSHGVR